MKQLPCKLNIEFNRLLVDINNNNSYMLYRRNKLVQLKEHNLVNKMWKEETDEIKEFYKILMVEGNRRFKLKNQRSLNYYHHQHNHHHPNQIYTINPYYAIINHQYNCNYIYISNPYHAEIINHNHYHAPSQPDKYSYQPQPPQQQPQSLLIQQELPPDDELYVAVTNKLN